MQRHTQHTHMRRSEYTPQGRRRENTAACRVCVTLLRLRLRVLMMGKLLVLQKVGHKHAGNQSNSLSSHAAARAALGGNVLLLLACVQPIDHTCSLKPLPLDMVAAAAWGAAVCAGLWVLVEQLCCCAARAAI